MNPVYGSFQMYEAKFTDGGDCYEIYLTMGKPGIPSKGLLFCLFVTEGYHCRSSEGHTQ